jgi:hypothetical protein
MAPTLGSILAIAQNPTLGIPFQLPFMSFALDLPIPVCLPVLTGGLTVSANTVGVVVRANQIQLDDTAVVVINNKLGAESRFARDDLAYAFSVPGAVNDDFDVKTTTLLGTRAATFRILPASGGSVKIALTPDVLDSTVSEVLVTNQSSGPGATPTHFLPASFELELPVGGGMGDGYSVQAKNSTTGDRPILFGLTPSSNGPKSLLLRARPGTIDPTQAEINAYNNVGRFKCLLDSPPCASLPPPIQGSGRAHVYLRNNGTSTVVEVDPALIVGGGFTFAFDGALTDSYLVKVVYDDGHFDEQDLPRFKLIVVNNAGTAVKTIVLPSPPKDHPLNLGSLSDDVTPPAVTVSRASLLDFDPSRPLTITFSESMDVASVRANVKVYDRANNLRAGWRPGPG